MTRSMARDACLGKYLFPAHVARESGFGKVQYLGLVLSKAAGCAPAKYRRRYRDHGGGVPHL